MLGLECIRTGAPGRTREPKRCKWCKADMPAGSIVSLEVRISTKTWEPYVEVMHRDCFEVYYRVRCLHHGWHWGLNKDFWERWGGLTPYPSWRY